jgi:uncharacterized membrane protein YbaN (DUF454 family)
MHRPSLHQIRSRGQRLLWMLAGLVSLLVGIVGIFVPLLPTTPLVLLAAFCFSRGSERLEAWLLGHPRFGPMVRAWRRDRSVPLRAKQFATAMMAISATGTWWVVQSPWRWAPAVVCACVAVWLWRLPTTPSRPIDR